MEIDHEIIYMVIRLPSADSFKKGCCQLQAKVCAQITGKRFVQGCPGKDVVSCSDRPAMTIVVDLKLKSTKQTNKAEITFYSCSFVVKHPRKHIYMANFVNVNKLILCLWVNP